MTRRIFDVYYRWRMFRGFGAGMLDAARDAFLSTDEIYDRAVEDIRRRYRA